MSSSGFLLSVLAGFAKALDPLRTAAASPEAFAAFLKDFGWTLAPADIGHVTGALGGLSALPADPSSVDAAQLAGQLAAAARLIRNIASSGAPAAFASTFPRELLDRLVYSALAAQAPPLFGLLHLVGVLSEQRVPASSTTGRAEYVERRVAWNQLSALADDPVTAMKQAYGWGGAFDADGLLRSLGIVVRGFGGVAGIYGAAPDLVGEYFDRDATAAAGLKNLVISAGSLGSAMSADSVKLAFLALPIPPAANRSAAPDGLALMPVVTGQAAATLPISQNFSLALAGDFLSRPVRAELHPAGAVLRASPGDTHIDASARLDAKAPSAGPWIPFGNSTSSRLELSAAHIAVGLSGQLDGDLELTTEIGLDTAALVVDFSESDSLLQDTVSKQPTRSPLSLTIKWSSKTGFSLGGQPRLQVDLPVQQSLGGVATLQEIGFALGAGAGNRIEFDAMLTGTTSIGPVTLSVKQVGLAIFITTSADTDPPGALGNLDLGFGFKSPSGVGVAIDVAGLTGGGFLDHDDTKHEYAGLLQLDFHTFKLTAFGLVATVLPTGPGYSLIAMVDAEFPPIELGLGFALTGAGGLFGVHRTASVDALRAALTAHTLSNLLFPKNPIANAPQLLTELDTLFPAAGGRFIFGPIVRIEWGTPALLTLDLAVILELPEPVRLVLIAELAVLLPTPEEKLVEIHVSALGTIDFGTSEGALDAVLHDSRVMTFPLHGAMALRVNWSGQKTFLLAVGGVHPKFQPPPGFPKLERVGISMQTGPISKLDFDGYLAVSSNSLQIGAHIDIFVGVDGFGISGYLTFDTLIQRHPFHFDGDISGGVALSAGGQELMSLQLIGSLTGPAPWHAAGSVSFDVLWWTVTKSFSVTFGASEDATSLAKVDVGQLLRTALADPQNFAAQFAPGSFALVTLATPATSVAVVLAHPGAVLSVHQTVVPLGLTISRYGGSEPLGETRFDITGVAVNGVAPPPDKVTPVLDDFAPAQFLNLSDDDELASPSFEQLAAGVEFRGTTTFGSAISRTVAYETFYADTPDGPLREDTGAPAPFHLGVLTGILINGAAGRSSLARTGSARFGGPRKSLLPATLDFVIATTDQLTPSGVGAATGLSYSQARAALQAERALHPDHAAGLLVAARYEMPV
jgi:hypothetical protein